MAVQINNATFTGASSPEEASQIFKDIMTRALAEAAAEAVKAAISGAPLGVTGNPAIDGWEDFVRGAHIEVFWDKPAIAKSMMTQVSSFVPFQVGGAVNPAILGGSIEVGISIKGTF